VTSTGSRVITLPKANLNDAPVPLLDWKIAVGKKECLMPSLLPAVLVRVTAGSATGAGSPWLSARNVDETGRAARDDFPLHITQGRHDD